MKIEEKRVVGLTYELKISKLEDEIESIPFSVEIRDEEDPFYFIVGQSGLPEKFETSLIGLAEKDNFSFVLSVEEAYGYADEELLIQLPKSQFSKEHGFEEHMLQEGEFLPLMDESGYPMQAKILKTDGETLLLDFNHPLVGFNLHFEGQVTKIRKANPVELSSGVVSEESSE